MEIEPKKSKSKRGADTQREQRLTLIIEVKFAPPIFSPMPLPVTIDVATLVHQLNPNFNDMVSF